MNTDTSIIDQDPSVKTRKGFITYSWELWTRDVCGFCGPDKDHAEHSAKYPHDFQGEPTTKLFELAVISHNPERKFYSASVQNVYEKDRGSGFISRSYALFGALTIDRQGAPRYSAKTFQAFADDSLDLLRSIQTNPDVTQFL